MATTPTRSSVPKPPHPGAAGVSDSQRTVRAKRASVSARRLRERAAAGENVDGQRALVRMGKANTAVLVDPSSLREWDDDELRRGYRKDKNGQFRGKAPVVVPKACHDEIVRRTLSKVDELFRENTVQAVQALVDIATSAKSEDKDKLRAISMVLDRTLGKAADKIEVTGTAKWEIALNAGIVSVGMDGHEEDLDNDDDGEDD